MVTVLRMSSCPDCSDKVDTRYSLYGLFWPRSHVPLRLSCVHRDVEPILLDELVVVAAFSNAPFLGGTTFALWNYLDYGSYLLTMVGPMPRCIVQLTVHRIRAVTWYC